MKKNDDYGRKYSDKGFWAKIKKYAKDAGCDVIDKALRLYYALIDKDTPVWAKGVITGALGYFISPIDAIPDITPIVGYTDDMGVLVVALGIVAAHIKPEHIAAAKEKIKQWFGKV